jgi:GNAT superfamily N-acetyltransferase
MPGPYERLRFTIDYLAHHTDAIPTLAQWHHDQWISLTPGLTVADRIKGFERRATIGSVPTGFVALMNGEVAGMACLVECDLDTRPELTPWLATVLVSTNHRRQGIGSALCVRAAEEARMLGFARIYLFTIDKQRMYERLGWSPVEDTGWRGQQRITIMANDLVR